MPRIANQYLGYDDYGIPITDFDPAAVMSSHPGWQQINASTFYDPSSDTNYVYQSSPYNLYSEDGVIDPYTPFSNYGAQPSDYINNLNQDVDTLMAFNSSVFDNQRPPVAPPAVVQPPPAAPVAPFQQLPPAPEFNNIFGSTDTSLAGNPATPSMPSFGNTNPFITGLPAAPTIPTFVNTGGSLAPSLSLGNNFDGTTNPFNYQNPYHGPLPIPTDPTFGGNRLPELPVTTDPEVIGALDANTGLPILHDPPAVELDPQDIHPVNPMGPGNPTIYGGGQGGLLGSGLDIGIPGLISIGGLLGAGGGLLGLGGDMGGLFGGGGGQTNNSPPLIPPVVGPQPDPELPPTTPPVVGQDPQQNQPEPPITVPPIIPAGGPDENPQPVTLPPPIHHYPEPNPPPQEAPTPPITIPIVPPTGGPTPPPVENPNPPTTVPPPVINTPPIIPPVINPGTGGGGGGPPTIPPTPMPLPLDRNYYREGNQTNQDNSALLPGIFQNYQNYSGGYGQTDMANFAGLLSSLGINNSALTGFANQQTAAGNTALRSGNVADAGNLGGQALGILQQLNPNMYGSLNQTNTAAGATGSPSDIQLALERQAREGLALGGGLSAEDRRLAQQSAREAWSARGLVNSPGAVADEVLNRDSLARQRLAERQALASAVDQQGFSQRQQGFGNQIQNSLLQMQGAFNPFQTITSANTTNQGSNQQLFNQGAGFSSGSFGNQNVNSLVNPFNNYAQDVFNSNYNAANARYIAAGNNAAAMAGARDSATGEIANSFLSLIGNIYGANKKPTT